MEKIGTTNPKYQQEFLYYELLVPAIASLMMPVRTPTLEKPSS